MLISVRCIVAHHNFASKVCHLNLKDYVLSKLLSVKFITHADGSRGGTVFIVVCMFVCLSARYLKNMMQLGSASLTQKCSTSSPGNPFILWPKGQRSTSRVTKTVPAWVFALL